MLVLVVHFGRVGAADRVCPWSGLGRDREKVRVAAPQRRSGRSPNGCQGRGPLREARICKDGPTRGRRSSMSDRVESSYVGVDLSKGRLDVAFRPTGGHYRFSNDPNGIDALVCRLAKEHPALVVLEASGGYERPAAAALAASGLAVAVVNPRQARDFAKATGRLAKTDALDAESLARFAEALRPEPRAIPGEEALLLGEILDRRRQLIGMLVAENNRLSATASEPVRRRIW